MRSLLDTLYTGYNSTVNYIIITHTRARARARARVCVCVCVCVFIFSVYIEYVYRSRHPNNSTKYCIFFLDRIKNCTKLSKLLLSRNSTIMLLSTCMF